MRNENNASTKKGITLLGLGPGPAAALTREAWDWLGKVDTLYLRTRHHPIIAELPETLKIESFDADFETANDLETASSIVIERIISLGMEPDGVTYAVPGSPFIDETTCSEVAKRAQEAGITVRVIEGPSMLGPVIRALEIDPSPNLVLVDALSLGMRKTPGFAPSSPAVVTQITSERISAAVKKALMTVYPDEHPVRMFSAVGTGEVHMETLSLHAIDERFSPGQVCSLYVPILSPNASLEAFQEIVAKLRAPDGCPWDRKQTHQSLRPFLIEEAYEALDALDQGHMDELAEELGDLLLQIALHAQIATENGDFNLNNVIDGIGTKLIRRHPHVFSAVEVEGVSGVIQNWEAIKAEERKENGDSGKKGLLDGVPKALPALLQADEIVERVGRVRFDRLEKMGTVESIGATLDELNTAEADRQTALLGKLLLAAVSLAHTLEIEPESALREALNRFRQRFGTMEASTLADDRPLVDLSKADVDRLWEETNGQEDQDE
jgi:tetrapyrrole methylase family protein/MazG family protein